jgi:hypothetical protein
MDNPRQEIRQAELEQFFAAVASIGNPRTSEATSQVELEQFFAAVGRQVDQAEVRQRRIDRKLATGFNVFDLIEPEENKLSDVLADLLDPKGNHGQGDLFLRLFFEQLGLGSGARLTNDATVRREALTHFIPNDRRRIDVLVEARALILAIENKKDSPEQPDQVKDYLEHLDECSRASAISSILIYLTLNGRPPKSLKSLTLTERQQHQDAARLKCWSYQVDLRDWLMKCGDKCKAPKICHFLWDFIAYIETKLKRESENNEEDEADEE